MKNLYKIENELYIVSSSEKIKENTQTHIQGFNGDWFYNTIYNFIARTGDITSYDFKIILTTNKLLIKDGVQAIDDEFLEWFVKNSSCKRVEIRYTVDFNSKAVIIIPKEEPKQETIEEVELAILFHNTYERLAPSFGYETRVDTKSFDTTTPNGKLMIAVCKEIIKWQTERMYSEEDLKSAFFNGGNMKSIEEFNYWFEQFKK